MSAIRSCPWCGKSVYVGAASEDLVIDVKAGPCVAFSWHPACASADPVHGMLVAAMSFPDPLAEEPVLAAYEALRLQVVARNGPEALQRTIDVVRDWPEPGITLKGPGLKWGVKSFL